MSAAIAAPDTTSDHQTGQHGAELTAQCDGHHRTDTGFEAELLELGVALKGENGTL
jgi:hypothetical protein